jgi:hypothetical protein
MWVLLGALASAASALEQFATGFEPPAFTGLAGGSPLNGQQDFYLPMAGGATQQVYSYAGNTAGIAANPTGGQYFAGSVQQGGSVIVRSQRDVIIGAGGVWTLAADIAVRFIGVHPAIQFPAGLSLRDNPGDGFLFNVLAAWTDLATTASWGVVMEWSDLAGIFLREPLGPAFQNLLPNHWYRVRIRFDFSTNRVLSVALTDLTGGSTAVAGFTDRYLFGGSVDVHQPFAFRLFVGGDTTAGNIGAFDNVSVGTQGPFTDVDGNGVYDPLTDALLLLRYAFGFRGAVLIADALGPGCTRCNAASIEAYIASMY